MIAGIRSATETAGGRQVWSVTWPSTHGYSTGTTTITLDGRCPNCGEYHYYADTIYVPPLEPDERALAKQRRWEQNRAAVTRARIALQRALDDPRPEIPLPDRKRPYARPRTKKRVCAGSSRYRVMVN